MDEKDKIKAGLFFGITMSLFDIVWHLLTHDNPTAKTVIASIIFGLIGGAISGFLFGWLIGLFANSKYVQQATKIALEEEETILFETGANHFKGAEAVGGKLYLANKRLVFKSHKFNAQNHELSITPLRIIHVDKYKTLAIINNGLAVTTTGDKIEKFVVQKPALWFVRMTSHDGLQQVCL